MIYFDNAATSWPKPAATKDAMTYYMENIGSNPGRGQHGLSMEAARIILELRENLAKLFGVTDPLQIILTKNATEALNITTSGLLEEGDHVIASSMEHNALMRPLYALMERKKIELSFIPCSSEGSLDPEDIKPLIKSNTKAIYLTHVSNVTGTIMPIQEVAKIARAHDLIFCVDAAQSVGSVPISMERWDIDLAAFTGHKSLFGPTGTGGLYIKKGLEKKISPLIRGGTASLSDSMAGPEFLPDKFEAGTINAIGFAGLLGGLNYILAQGLGNIRSKEEKLTSLFLDGLSTIKGVKVFGPNNAEKQAPIVSFKIKNLNPSDISIFLDESYNIISRVGLHSAFKAHETIGTSPHGAIRLSFGYFNTEAEIKAAINAIDILCS